MKLYHSPQSRSVRPRWVLEEVGAPYELITLDTSKGENKSPEYLKIHPHGVVPALVDGAQVIFESAAICLYLADKFADKKLAPAISSPARGLYYQWAVYTMATLEPPVLQVFLNTIRLPEAQRSAAAAEDGRQKTTESLRVLSQALEGKPYLLGDQFTVADVLIGSTLSWAQMMGLVNGYPVLDQYVGRLSSRPAFQRAQSD